MTGVQTCALPILKNKNKNRVQSKETIENRINNTDQTKKEQTRQKTMTERYGSLLYAPNPKERNEKISKSLSGKPHSKNHHVKIIENKRKNNKLKHKNESKIKIKQKLLNYYSDDSIDHCITLAKSEKKTKTTKGFLCGYFNGIFFRSSYEKKFLEFCEKYKIKVESAENKNFRLRYLYEGKKHWYYPDFYLPDFDVVVEIKPLSLLDFDRNLEKINVGMLNYNFWLITEEELEENVFYEHILSF